MANWLIVLIVIISYFVLAGITGGLCDRLGSGFDVSITLATICPIGILIALSVIIWRAVKGCEIFEN